MKNKEKFIFTIIFLLFGYSHSYSATIYIDDTCSLSEAIISANTNTSINECETGDSSEADTIILEIEKVYSLRSTYEIGPDGENGLPSISSSVIILGNGSTIQRIQDLEVRDYFRIFHISESGNLTLENITISGGYTAFHSLTTTSKYGAGLFNRGILTLNNCIVTKNWAAGSIYNELGSVTLNNSLITENDIEEESSYIAGIYNEAGTIELNYTTISKNTGTGLFNAYRGKVTLHNSTVSDNAGSGIINSWGDMVISSSTISHNETFYGEIFGGPGGGIINRYGTMSIYNSTISNNTSTSVGGGIYNSGSSHNHSGILHLINCTLSDNVSEDDNFEGSLFNGKGAIYNTKGFVYISNTIVANSDGVDCGGDIADSQGNDFGIVDKGNNWFEDNTCRGVADGDPRLEPLQNNGGFTKTHALADDSGAIDKGDDAICSSTSINNFDQRGIKRPQGKHCDIGSFEKQDKSNQTAVSPYFEILLLRHK